MRVIVTGSRNWKDMDAVWSSLDVLYDNWIERMDGGGYPGDNTFVVVHGDAPSGADRMAKEWAMNMAVKGHPVMQLPYRADWKRDGNKAGILRNQKMVKAWAHVCLAFIVNHSKGATHCAETAGLDDIKTLVLRDPPCPDCAGKDLALSAMGLPLWGEPRDVISRPIIIGDFQNDPACTEAHPELGFVCLAKRGHTGQHAGYHGVYKREENGVLYGEKAGCAITWPGRNHGSQDGGLNDWREYLEPEP